MVRLFVSILLVLVVWYAVRVILEGHPPALIRIVDLAAVVFVVLLALRYSGLL